MLSTILTVTYTIQDAKGKKSRLAVVFPKAAREAFTVLDDFVESTALLIDNLVRGKVVSASLTWSYDLRGIGAKAAPLPNSDVEEGAIFDFGTAQFKHKLMRLATFDEEFYRLGAVKLVDTSNSDVDAFVQRIIDGRTILLANVSPSDDHGDDLTYLDHAIEQFQHYNDPEA